MSRVIKLAASFVAAVAVAAIAAPAEAASTIRSPNPPDYKVEIEPHLLLQPGGFYYQDQLGLGFGARFSIPVMSPGFIKTINDSIAISFGPDLVHYDGYNTWCNVNVCYDASYWRLYFPVAMQWNFFLTDKWSVFGEPGLVFRTNLGDNCVPGAPCNQSTIAPAFWAGARFHFSDRVALTMRVGFPEALSVGVSFF